ncbi:MAG: VOC family protein [Burkholderiales bacterium]|nr:VOC family protein [Burkholderiales bacterium]
MLKIRHLAFASRNPGKSAEFYKKAFGWRELRRTGKDPDNPSGVILSDGSLNISILSFSNNQTGKGPDFEGFHHMGVVVDDVPAWAEKLEAMGSACIVGEDRIPPDAQYEIKFQGPDDVVFDITDVAWPGSTALDGAPAPERVPSAAEEGRSRFAPGQAPGPRSRSSSGPAGSSHFSS